MPFLWRISSGIYTDRGGRFREGVPDALSLIVETGDFNRFANGNVYAAYLGLAPRERSSAEKIKRMGITKAGNSHLRLLLVEAAGGICKGAVGHKSKETFS